MSGGIYLVLAIIFASMAIWLHLKIKEIKSMKRKSAPGSSRISHREQCEDELDEFTVAFLDEDEDEEN